MGREEIQGKQHEKDMGVIIHSDLLPGEHINNLLGEAYRMLRNVKTALIT